MGIFVNENDIMDKVQKVFNDTKNYVVAFQNRSIFKQLIILIFSNLMYSIDGSRTFILYFDKQGIYEAENSFSDKSQFLLMPWHEITDFKYKDKGNKIILNFSHLGQKRGYSIEFDGVIMKDNRENVLSLIKKDWNRI